MSPDEKICSGRRAWPGVAAVAFSVFMGCACAPQEKPAARYETLSMAPADEDDLVRVVPEGKIVAVDQPSFTGAEEAARFMRPEEMVVGVVVGGQPRAYSLWHLDRHEVVNDRSGELPFVVSWCPIAGTARAFSRQVAGRELNFLASGQLWRNALVLRDRETRSLWSQVSGAALEGVLAGAELSPLPVEVSSWSDWLRVHPDTLVLRKPRLEGPLYVRYRMNPDRVGLYGQRRSDPRLAPKTEVLGVQAGGQALAVPLSELRRARMWNGSVGAMPVLLAVLGSSGPELGYDRSVPGQVLSFEPEPDPFRARDRETGTLWDLVSGRALEGALAGQRLRRVVVLRAYWFIWSGYHPRTQLERIGAAAGAPLGSSARLP
ncbi:MAG: DUF3179 domain-containing (seleno)protein [Acidobacteriota bacterium]